MNRVRPAKGSLADRSVAVLLKPRPEVQVTRPRQLLTLPDKAGWPAPGHCRIRSEYDNQDAGGGGGLQVNGQLLRSALEKKGPSWLLDKYIDEVFQQLDYHLKGSVLKEDFDTLCEVLNIAGCGSSTRSGHSSMRNSILLEWLPSYSPRRSHSPLKFRHVSEVKVGKAPGSSTASLQSGPDPDATAGRTNFLFTLGPRPFWELWPQKKKKRSGYNREEFRQALLDQWTLHLRHRERQQMPPSPIAADAAPRSAGLTCLTKLWRRAARVARRCAVLDKLQRRHLCSSHLHHQVLDQQLELDGLRAMVQELRESLQLSEAQNLALQVLLKKIAKAEGQLPAPPAGPGESLMLRRRMNESEKQLERLVRELKEMSQTKYPTSAALQTTSTTSCSIPLPEAAVEDEFQATFQALSQTSDELQETQKQLHLTTLRLQQKDLELDQSKAGTRQAEKALVKAQAELGVLRSELGVVRQALDCTKKKLLHTGQHLRASRAQLSRSEMLLEDAEARLRLAQDARTSLVVELEQTKRLLVSSIAKVHDLELESQKVPLLEKRLQQLAFSIRQRRGHKPDLPVRSLRTLDSGLNSSSDSDDQADALGKGGSEELDNSYSTELDLTMSTAASSSTSALQQQQQPVRPMSREKLVAALPMGCSRQQPRTGATLLHEAHEEQMSSPDLMRITSPSSGRHSAGSKLFISSPSMSPLSSDQSVPSPKSLYMESKSRKASSAGLLSIRIVDQNDSAANSGWVGVLESERIRLHLLDEKLKEVLQMLKSLNAMSLTAHDLGQLVLRSVQHSLDPCSQEVAVFKFLSHLYSSVREFEHLIAQHRMQAALSRMDEDEDATEHTAA